MDKGFKTYLENVIELEKNAYTQRETLREMNRQINNLGIRGCVTRVQVNREASWIANLLAYGFVCVPIGAVWFGAKGLFSNFLSGAIGGIFEGAFYGLIVAAIIALIKFAIEYVKENNLQEEYDARYYREKAVDDKRVEAEIVKKKRLIELRNQLSEQHTKTQNALKEYYGVGIIYQKYQSMNAVCCFYEYLVSGRCSQLTGHEGAYNLYESELFACRILDKLDVILENLEQIKGNQFTLYYTLSEGNKKIDSLLEETERQTRLSNYVAEQTAIAAYNSAQANNKLNQLKWLKTYELTKRGY